MKIAIVSLGLAFIVTACSPNNISTSSSNDSGNSSSQSQAADTSESNTSQNEAGNANTTTSNIDFSQYNIITLLPRDAIPAIDDPQYYDVAAANQEYADDEQIIGIEFNGEARAYSTGLLSRHEIVNDTVGGRKISVTW